MSPINRKALLSFVLGLLAVPTNVLTGLPALAIGLIGLREINIAEGRERGRWMCVVGIVMGILVVVSDIVALGAYVVLQRRYASALYACQYNLKQLSDAVEMYESHRGIFPPGTVANASLRPAQRLSWLVSLLPYYVDLESQRRKVAPSATSLFEVYVGIDPNRAWDDPANREATARVLGQFVCPSHPAFAGTPSLGPTYYVGISGIGSNAAELPLSDPKCGLFGYDREVLRDDVQRGASYTMIACETSWQNGPWAQGGFATVRGLDPNDLPYTGRGRPFGGLHPDTTNRLFADGSVQAFHDTGSAKEFATLATLKGD